MVAVVVLVVCTRGRNQSAWRGKHLWSRAFPPQLKPTRTHDTMHTTVQNLMARASSAAPHLSLMSGHLSQPEKTTAGHQNTQ